MDRNYPLFLKWGYLPKLMPWLRKYLAHANAEDARRIANGLAQIVPDSVNEHMEIARGTPAERFIAMSDYNFGYRDRAHFEGDAFGWGIRRDHGMSWDVLEGRVRSASTTPPSARPSAASCASATTATSRTPAPT